MKKLKWLFLSMSLAIVLTACGGENENNSENLNNDPGDNNNVENDVNNEENDNSNDVNNDINNNENNDENDENSNEANENNNNNDAENNSNDINGENNNNNDNANEEAAAVIDDVTLYFSDDQLLETYRVSSGVSVNEDETGAFEAMELWAAGPTQDGLYPLLPEGTNVDYVEFHDDTAHVSFSEEINEANLGSSGELMLTEQIALMMEQFGFDQTQILIEGDDAGDFLGHMTLSDPVEAGNPDDYEWYE